MVRSGVSLLPTLGLCVLRHLSVSSASDILKDSVKGYKHSSRSGFVVAGPRLPPASLENKPHLLHNVIFSKLVARLGLAEWLWSSDSLQCRNYRHPRMVAKTKRESRKFWGENTDIESLGEVRGRVPAAMHWTLGRETSLLKYESW